MLRNAIFNSFGPSAPSRVLRNTLTVLSTISWIQEFQNKSGLDPIYFRPLDTPLEPQPLLLLRVLEHQLVLFLHDA
jgi:hypothetical protein